MLKQWLPEKGLLRPPPLGADSLWFFDPRDAATGFLSNFYRAPFRLHGHEWPTVEHFYQAHKCRDALFQSNIRMAPSPKAAKQLARAAEAGDMRPDWQNWRMTVMLQALAAKFVQNPPLADQLVATGERILVEASPTDAFWGNGPDGQGQNRLGYLLTTLRTVLRGCREQGLAVYETGLFRALLDAHQEWWAFEAQREREREQQTAFEAGHVKMVVRDTELSHTDLDRYQPGTVLVEPAPLTCSGNSRAGLAANTRFVLLSTSVRLLGDLSLHAAATPCVCPPGRCWKVMGRHTAAEHPCHLVVLLEIPEPLAYLFDSIIFTDLEGSLYFSVKNAFDSMLLANPNPACLHPDWLAQVSGPIGFTDGVRGGKIWINGIAQSPSV